MTPMEELKAPTKKKKEIFVTTYNLQDEFQKKIIQTKQVGFLPNLAENISTLWY